MKGIDFMHTLKPAASILLIAFILAVTALPTMSAQAEPAGTTITVTTFADELNSNGNCSLREAIRSANLNTNVDGCPAGNATSRDDIVLSNGTYNLTISGIDENEALTGDLDITGPVHIGGKGTGSTFIDGNALNDRVFHVVEAGIQVEITNLVIQHGNAADSTPYGGGAILNNGDLTILNCVLKNNQTNRIGGAVDNTNIGTLLLKNSTIHDNTAPDGGGLFNGGTALIESVTFYNNDGGESGGAIDNYLNATLTNVTISNNTATSGGGIFTDGMLTMLNCTITGNSSGIANRGDTRTISTIIANSVGGSENNCTDSTITSEGNNLDSGTSCNFNNVTDLNNTNPQLGALGENGGPTWTHALLEGSPAIDKGNDQECPRLDQRGALRPADGNGDDIEVCDIGSYEYNGAFPAFIYLPIIQR